MMNLRGVFVRVEKKSDGRDVLEVEQALAVDWTSGLKGRKICLESPLWAGDLGSKFGKD